MRIDRFFAHTGGSRSGCVFLLALSAGAARHAPQSGLSGRGRRHTLPASPRLTPGNNTEISSLSDRV
ncbi:hypothetical protein C2E23DRAFT_801379 [Lenzites betulinus]|nr:hypothetical protein C2E23DRAFT_801379 [Lenzites betulinus]